MKDSLEKGTQESFIRRVLTSEVKFILAVLAIAAPYFSMRTDMALLQKDVALIQQSINTIQLNHEKHIEDIVNQLEKQNIIIAEHSVAIAKIMERLAK